MEKMCSGAYLGPVSLIALKTAAKEGLFSKSVAEQIIALPKLELIDIDKFLYKPFNEETLLGGILAKGTQEDRDTLFLILDAFVERSARLSCAIISAAVIKSGKGTKPSLPVCVSCDGTTLFKTHNLQPRLRGYLNEVLTVQRNLYFDIVAIDTPITKGAAVAAV